MNYREEFDHIRLVFKESSLWDDMVNTFEDSPYHRESSTAIHTNMVVKQYIARSPNVWSYEDFIGGLTSLFHDVGKPMSEETLFNDEGKAYRRYANHEKMSTNIFIEWAITNTDLDLLTIYHVGVLIQFHLPNLENKIKLASLRKYLEKYDLVDVYIRCLYSDGYGRISDNNNVNVSKALVSYKERLLSAKGRDRKLNQDNTITLLSGVMGSGKSTWVKDNVEDEIVMSYDVYRHKFFDNIFNHQNVRTTLPATDKVKLLFKEFTFGKNNHKNILNDLSVNDKLRSLVQPYMFVKLDLFRLVCKEERLNKKFIMKVKFLVDLHKHLKGNKDVVIDNMNISNKEINTFISNNYTKRKLVIFFDTFENIFLKVKNRKNKFILKSRVKDVLYIRSLPLLTEFDTVEIINVKNSSSSTVK